MLTLRADKPKKEKKERTPRAQWLAAHPQERTAPWKQQGISRSKFFKDRKVAREDAEKKQRWREALRKQADQWLKARQVRRSVNMPIWIIRKNTDKTHPRGQVCSYIMSARVFYPYIRSLYGLKYMLCISVRGP